MDVMSSSSKSCGGTSIMTKAFSNPYRRSNLECTCVNKDHSIIASIVLTDYKTYKKSALLLWDMTLLSSSCALDIDTAVYNTDNESDEIDRNTCMIEYGKTNSIGIQVHDDSLIAVIATTKTNMKRWQLTINYDIDNSRQTSRKVQRVHLNGTIDCDDVEGSVECCCMSSNGTASLTGEGKYLIVRNEQLKMIRRYGNADYKGGMVTACAFSSNDSIIVFIYETGMLLIYDFVLDVQLHSLPLLKAINQSCIDGGSSGLCSLLPISNTDSFLVGSRDGKLRLIECFHSVTSAEYREVYTFDLVKCSRNSIVDVADEDVFLAANGKAKVITTFNAMPVDISSHVIDKDTFITVLTTTSIIILKLHSGFTVYKIISFDSLGHHSSISTGKVVCISSSSTLQVVAVVISAFTQQGTVYITNHSTDSMRSKETCNDVSNLIIESSSATAPMSFIGLGPHSCSDEESFILSSSKLQTVKTPAVLSGARLALTWSKLRGDWEKPLINKGGRICDQPVTFHSKIKSSGYGQHSSSSSGSNSSRRRLESKQKTLQRTMTTSAPAAHACVGSRLRRYPIACSLLTQHQPQNDISIKSPIHAVTYSEDGSSLAYISGESTVTKVHMPASRNGSDGISYMGHDKRVLSISFSHSKEMILSSSCDATARIWKGNKVDTSAVVFSHYLHHPGVLSHSSSSNSSSIKTSILPHSQGLQSRNKPYTDEIHSSSFFYTDKFVLLAVKNEVLLYAYDTEGVDAKNDLKRLQSQGKYSLTHKFTLPSQTVTSMSCINSVQNHLIAVGTSSKKLIFLDAYTGVTCREVQSQHDRSIHHIALPKPSIYCQFTDGLEAYNMFATAATDNAIFLWDIRAPKCIGRYTNHVNRRESIECSLSPCMRYVATGSEDKTCRVFDIRTGTEVVKLSGYHKDVVSSVAWNPLFPQLSSSSFDGSIKFYTLSDSSLQHYLG